MSFQWLYPPSISLAPRRATSLPFGLPWECELRWSPIYLRAAALTTEIVQHGIFGMNSYVKKNLA